MMPAYEYMGFKIPVNQPWHRTLKPHLLFHRQSFHSGRVCIGQLENIRVPIKELKIIPPRLDSTKKAVARLSQFLSTSTNLNNPFARERVGILGMRLPISLQGRPSLTYSIVIFKCLGQVGR